MRDVVPEAGGWVDPQKGCGKGLGPERTQACLRPEHQGQVVLAGRPGRWRAGMVGGPLEEVHVGSRGRQGLRLGRAPRPTPVPFPHRIHLMAGRVPQGADRTAVRGEMETVFLENLRHAAEVLARVR